MNNTNTQEIPRSFYVVALAAVLWNLFGILAYLGQVTLSPEAIAELPLEQQPLYRDIPIWATAAYAIAVTAGVVGSVLLLLRKAWALPVLVISLLGVIVQFAHAMLLTDMMAVTGVASLVLAIAIIVIAVFLIWYCVYSKKQGWIA